MGAPPPMLEPAPVPATPAPAAAPPPPVALPLLPPALLPATPPLGLLPAVSDGFEGGALSPQATLQASTASKACRMIGMTRKADTSPWKDERGPRKTKAPPSERSAGPASFREQ